MLLAVVDVTTDIGGDRLRFQYPHQNSAICLREEAYVVATRVTD